MFHETLSSGFLLTVSSLSSLHYWTTAARFKHWPKHVPAFLNQVVNLSPTSHILHLHSLKNFATQRFGGIAYPPHWSVSSAVPEAATNSRALNEIEVG